MDKHTSTLASVVVGICVAGCSSPEEANPLGSASLALNEVPAGITCLRVTVANPVRSVTRSLDVVPGQPVDTALQGLPTGEVTVTAAAFPLACAAVTPSSDATWRGGPQDAVITPPASTPIVIVLRPNGRSQLSVDFQADIACLNASATGNERLVGAVGNSLDNDDSTALRAESTTQCDPLPACGVGASLAATYTFSVPSRIDSLGFVGSVDIGGGGSIDATLDDGTVIRIWSGPLVGGVSTTVSGPWAKVVRINVNFSGGGGGQNGTVVGTQLNELRIHSGSVLLRSCE